MLLALQRCTQAPGTWAPQNAAQQWGRPPQTDSSQLSGSTSLSSRWVTGLCFHGSSVAEQQLQHKASHSPQKNSNRRRWFGRAGTWGEVGSRRSAPRRVPGRERSAWAGNKWWPGREGTLPAAPLSLALCSESTRSLPGRERTLSSSPRSLLPLRLTEHAGESLAVSLTAAFVGSPPCWSCCEDHTVTSPVAGF